MYSILKNIMPTPNNTSEQFSAYGPCRDKLFWRTTIETFTFPTQASMLNSTIGSGVYAKDDRLLYIFLWLILSISIKIFNLFRHWALV